MNQWIRRGAAVSAAALMMLTTLPALAAEGTVNTGSLVLRKSASKDSQALQTLEKGDTVTVQSQSGDWYKVRYGSYTGYVMKQYLKVTGEVESAEKAASSDALRPGDSGSRVKSLQQSLKDLGLYTGSVDGNYGSGTVKAVKAFQKQQGLTQDGVAGSKTLAALEKASREETSQTLRPGDKGSAVKSLQQSLKKLGLYTGSVDGVYGSGTTRAVKLLQKQKGLTQDGVAGSKTLAALATASKDDFTPATEQLKWFGHEDTIPKGAVVTIKDCLTGKTFQAKRWSGANHMDTEPLTKDDAATIKEIFGGSWSWRRRVILVKYDGHVYAASMNGMPHGTSTIDNGFDGHFCVHFLGSKTHESDKVDSEHQNAVETAMKYTW